MANPRHVYARRVRALEGRIERLRTQRSVVALFGELMELEEWWAHQPDNSEALRIIATCRENGAWERARRSFWRSHEAQLAGRYALAGRLWARGRRQLEIDWWTMYRREPCPAVEDPAWARERPPPCGP